MVPPPFSLLLSRAQIFAKFEGSKLREFKIISLLQKFYTRGQVSKNVDPEMGGEEGRQVTPLLFTPHIMGSNLCQI